MHGERVNDRKIVKLEFVLGEKKKLKRRTLGLLIISMLSLAIDHFLQER